MDFNDFFMPSLLPYGRYDTAKVHTTRTRVWVNYLCAFIEFFCALKMVVIIAWPWQRLDITLYLIELYIVNNSLTRVYYICIVCLHLHCGFNYVYFGYLCRNPRMLRCVDMFFMPDFDELCRRYDLEPISAKRFVKKSRIYRHIMTVLIWGFQVTFFLFILRCLVVSYATIPFDYFLYLACPMGLITVLSFCLLGESFLRTQLMLLLTMEFLVLRAENVAVQIRRTFRGCRPHEADISKWVLLKRKKSTMRVLKTLNDIVNQFKESNHIFDNLISGSMVGTLLGGLVFPAFVFVNIPIYHKLIVIVIYSLSVVNNCFIISIFNDEFLNKIKTIESAIHRVMSAFEGYEMKMKLSGFVLLNSGHQKICFTYLHHFDYSTNDLIEYLMHSVSLVMMIIQAIWSGPSSMNLFNVY